MPYVSTLRTHLVLLVLGVLVPGTLVTGLLVWQAITQSRSVVEDRLREAARVDADALDRQFDDATRALATLARSDALQRGDLRAFYEEASHAAESQPGWAAIVLLDEDGQPLLHTAHAFGQPIARTPDMASLDETLRTNAPVVGRLMTVSDEPKLRFTMQVPATCGAQRCALGAIIDPLSLQRLIVSGLSSSEGPARTLIDPSWTIAARSRDNDRFAGTPSAPEAVEQLASGASSFFRRVNRDGVDVYVASQRNRYGWTSLVAVPAQLIDEPARASVQSLLIGGVLLTTVAVLSVLVVSGRLSQDLASARAAAAALAQGQPLPEFKAHVAEGEQLHESLVAAADLLRVRERAKDEFLAVLGHELRNPLAPATTALELMKLKGGNTLQRERDVLERQVSHLTRLVDDLLDASRLTSGKVELRCRRFELRTAVSRAIDMAQPLITERQHRLDVDVPASGLELDADQDRVVQILVNLLTNAARYTPAGGRIRLSAHTEGPLVVLYCDDTGPGIAADLLSTMFEPFVQGPRKIDRREGGLGLGLALSRNLAHLHGGTLDAINRQQGCRLVLRLPAAPPATELDDSAPTLAIDATERRRVLVVDDNADAREMLQVLLETAGHEVHSAGTGATAVTLARQHAFDVAVLDIGLPGMDGYEVAAMLRTLHPRIRLIAVTGYGQPSDVDASHEAGFNAHCTKPIDFTTLLKELTTTDVTV